ncbi:hypothetical protein NIES2101_26415 [Calothrix sp. HK-06]|nr:hypothetical protein NIES2101_26415 [Calothrix sp. HK-06]
MNDAIIGIVTSIMAYKFQQLSRKDIDTMLGITLEETRVFQEAIEIGQERATADVIFRLLKKRFRQEVSEELRARIQSLPLPALRKLTEDLLDFSYDADLQTWLKAQ